MFGGHSYSLRFLCGESEIYWVKNVRFWGGCFIQGRSSAFDISQMIDLLVIPLSGNEDFSDCMNLFSSRQLTCSKVKTSLVACRLRYGYISLQ